MAERIFDGNSFIKQGDEPIKVIVRPSTAEENEILEIDEALKENIAETNCPIKGKRGFVGSGNFWNRAKELDKD